MQGFVLSHVLQVRAFSLCVLLLIYIYIYMYSTWQMGSVIVA